MDKAICASRGPRVADDGVPYCKLELGHEGVHRAHPEDGWGSNGAWPDPPMYNRAVRREFAEAGMTPWYPQGGGPFGAR